jgi:carbonic anhydrase
MSLSSQQALDRLRAGNRRFVAGESLREGDLPGRRRELVEGQQPYAVILGCSDSRVPAERVFDESVGGLFVVRVVGNIARLPELGSIEFAAVRLGVRLVVVLGHDGCGGIAATLEALRQPADMSEPLLSIVDGIRPSVEALLATSLADDLDMLARAAVRAHVRATVRKVREGSESLRQLVDADKLLVVGAEYALETGAVDFFEGLRS